MNLSDCLSLHWALVGSLVLLVEAVHFSSARRAGGPSQPLLNQIWDLVLRRSYKDHLFKVRKMWKKMFTLGFQCMFIALGVKRCRSDIGCFGCFGGMNLSDCLSLHWTLVGSLVLLVEAVHFSSCSWIKFETWCYGAPIRTISSKLGRCEKRCLHWVSSACS